MYIPASFNETDPQKLFDFIQRSSFGLLVSELDGEPFASHLPFLVDRNLTPQGCLIGHMARANPQWRHADGKRVLAVFSGPHAYISPTWYEAENVVPTWNYVAVHVYGTFHAVHDDVAMLQVVGETVEFYESGMPQPWKFGADGEFSQKLVQGIVAFRIEITRLEGKWKLSQNHPPERREKVIQNLSASVDQDARETAGLMSRSIEPH